MKLRASAWLVVVCTTTAAAGLLTACGSTSPTPPAFSGVTINASDTACSVAATTFQSGTLTFVISNAGSQVTEVYVYAPGDRIVGEVDNIGPSTSKKLTVALKPGQYQVTCKPGMVGKGIRTPITVKGPAGASPTSTPQLDAAVAGYRSYVLTQAALLQTRAGPFIAAVLAGSVAKAKSLYGAARAPYESIQPIAESFGDLDPRIDARIDDVENGQEWTGFHRLEHDLWTNGDVSKDGPVARQLHSDIARLVAAVQHVELSADEIANAAKSLVAGAVTSRLTGEEERYSGLDLVDCSADIQSAFAAYQALRPVVLATKPDLVAKLDARFTAVHVNLAQYGSGTSFQLYDTLSKAQIRSLATEVTALLDPLNDLDVAVLKA